MAFEKRNHHYVPQFWQRGFRDQADQLYGRFGTTTKQVWTSSTMRGDWLYTIFDSQWNPSDSLEDALSVEENAAAALLNRICRIGSATSVTDRDELCSFLALQACRHPDIMGRGYRRSRELGALLAKAHDLTYSEFTNELVAFAVSADDAQALYKFLIAKTREQLAKELDELIKLSPQDAQLPEQEALQAQPVICAQLKKMDFTLLDAPAGSEFVLSDTPIPQQDLSHGFSVPLSKSVAVWAIPSMASQTNMARRAATTTEVDAINKDQWERSLHIVIGPSKAVLAAL